MPPTGSCTILCSWEGWSTHSHEMMPVLTPLLIAVAAAAQPAPPAPTPAAMTLFERDWVLNQWAKQRFDANGDGRISLEEAQPAAIAFKEIADGNSDGRVTPYEYERAREFILARY